MKPVSVDAPRNLTEKNFDLENTAQSPPVMSVGFVLWYVNLTSQMPEGSLMVGTKVRVKFEIVNDGVTQKILGCCAKILPAYHARTRKNKNAAL